MPRQYIWLKDREINNQFSRWLYRRIMADYGSVDVFSYESGICKSKIYSWINGYYKPGRKSLKILSKIFRVPIDYLVAIMED